MNPRIIPEICHTRTGDLQNINLEIARTHPSVTILSAVFCGYDTRTGVQLESESQFAIHILVRKWVWRLLVPTRAWRSCHRCFVICNTHTGVQMNPHIWRFANNSGKIHVRLPIHLLELQRGLRRLLCDTHTGNSNVLHKPKDKQTSKPERLKLEMRAHAVTRQVPQYAHKMNIEPSDSR